MPLLPDQRSMPFSRRNLPPATLSSFGEAAYIGGSNANEENTSRNHCLCPMKEGWEECRPVLQGLPYSASTITDGLNPLTRRSRNQTGRRPISTLWPVFFVFAAGAITPRGGTLEVWK
jgi:hypothetical protein